MPSFDPYHKWLGIPPGEQPPNHYRLLGVPLWEPDPEVIEAAAERQTVFLRTFQIGPQAELAEKLLNEVARARVTLLSANQKVAYDQRLRKSLGFSESLVPEPPADVLSEEVDRLRETLKERDRELQERDRRLDQQRADLAHQQQRLELEAMAQRSAPEEPAKSGPVLLQPRKKQQKKKIIVPGGIWLVGAVVVLIVLIVAGVWVRSSVRSSATQQAALAKFEAEKVAAADKREAERVAAEKIAAEKSAAEKREAELAAAEKLAAEKAAAAKRQAELGDPIVNTIDMVLVPIPAGEFMMGSPDSEEGRDDDETQHRVRITKPFYLSAHEVTQAQYEQVMGNNPSSSKGPTKPVETVSWHDAVAFCRRLSEQEGVEYRLPTEAEWEYACRAETTTTYSFGNDVSGLGEYAWHITNSSSTHPVGKLKPNAWGLYDMRGNVWEWCQDWYGPYSDQQVVGDPTGPAAGSNRVLRGGAFNLHPLLVRAAIRNFIVQPEFRIHDLGFRLARTYPLSPITSPTVEKPVIPPPAPPESPPAKPELVAAIKKLMTPKQVALGGPIVNSVDIILVPIPPGEFTMGSPESEADRKSEETQHLVKITKPFYLSAHEVTQAQYERVMGKNPSSSKDPTKPVEQVSWNDAVAFCGKLSDEEGVEYRLPTEAEWEYACRAGTTMAYSFGDDARQLPQYAWHIRNSNSGTHPVGSLKPNAWGLYDIHGNVYEWCQDWHGPYESVRVVSDPTGAASGQYRVLRGGAFNDPPKYVRAAYRVSSFYHLPVNRNRSPNIGFRLARTYSLSPITSPTVEEPKPPAEPPKMSRAQRALAARIKQLMPREQKRLGGPVVNSVDIVLMPIPPGEFMMGSPESEANRQSDETQHLVKITKPFYLSAHEVTQAQYERVMGNNPRGFEGPAKPVIVSWNNAVAFCGALSEREGVEYRLPTEAEWEYACRAGATTAYSFGDDERQLPQYAWYSRNTRSLTHPVGELKPNAWGLFDMHGNVREWCQDWYEPYESLKVVSDPTGAAAGSRRVLRGGSGDYHPVTVRAASRYSHQPDFVFRTIGFRLARTYSLSPITSPTVEKPKPRAEPPKMSRAQRVLASPIKRLMTREQKNLGGPVVNSVDIILVPIPPGEFMMGSPESEPERRDNETQHLVKITKPFYLSVYEVTQSQYQRVMGNNPSDSKGPTKPVEEVSWNDAVAFCGKLSEQEGAEYRLPTEAEWEYACRAGTSTAWCFGDDERQLPQYAWYKDNSKSTTHPVGGLKPNAWGLFDMHGNVAERCQDWYGNYDRLQVVSDPTGAASGSRRVLRGGAFLSQPVVVRAAYRSYDQPDVRGRYFGFRLARTYPLSP